MIEQSALKALAGAMSANDAETVIEANAVVVSAGAEIWVRLEGSTQSTPITSTTVKVAQGDTVTVRIADGKASITGNVSKPSTDDALAVSAMDTASYAKETAEDTAEHFYADEKGAHIEGEKYRNDLTSEGMDIVRKSDGGIVARFASSVASLLGGLFKMSASGTEYDYECYIGARTNSGTHSACETSYKTKSNGYAVASHAKAMLDNVAASAKGTMESYYDDDGGTISSSAKIESGFNTLGSSSASVTASCTSDGLDSISYVNASADHVTVGGFAPLIVRSKQIVNQTSTATSSYRQFTQQIDSIAGYKPVAVAGYSFYNSSVWAVNRCYLSSDTQVSFSIRDLNNSKAQSMTGTSYVYILYARSELM